jgi:hypothetical protein
MYEWVINQRRSYSFVQIENKERRQPRLKDDQPELWAAIVDIGMGRE